jgi:hypothetical protein
MTEGGLDLRSLLLQSSEPQRNKPRNISNKNNTNNTKENCASKTGNKSAKGKHSEVCKFNLFCLFCSRCFSDRYNHICFHNAGKKQPELLPLDKVQVERFFSVAENVVFTSHRPHSQPPPSSNTPVAPGIQDLALLTRLAISSPSKDCGSPMSIENYPQDEGGSPLPSPPIDLVGSHTVLEQKPEPLPPPQPLTAQEINLMYKQRCAADSDAMLASCPPHLLQVNQTYLKQAEAVKLADQCNAGLPIVIEPEVLISLVRELPKKPSQVIGAAAKPHTVDGAQQKLQLPLQQKPSPSRDQGNVNKTEAAGAESVPSSPEKTEDLDPLAPDAPKQQVYNFSYNFNDYLQAGDDEIAGGTEEHLEESEEDKESDRKRARSDESAALMQQLQDNYAAALAQLNAPAAAPLPALSNSKPPTTAEDAADPTRSGDSAPSSHDLPAPPLHQQQLQPLRRRNQEAIRVFCVEKLNERTGLFYRNFTATSYASVWRTYMSTRPGTLHWYEVIREGRPCHLYFDLEFGRSSAQNWNQKVDGDALVDKLLHHVGSLLYRNWGLQIDPQTQVYELDSSTSEKFSRHIIVRIPGHAFFHNLAIGHFVSQVIAAAGTEFDVFKGPPPSEERVSFVDTAVYTKNRHFRLVYSNKGGKTAVLKPTERYATAAHGEYKLKPSFARVFNDTLICNVDYDVKLLAVLPPLRDGLGGALFPAVGVGAVHANSCNNAAATVNTNGKGTGSGGIHQGDVYGRTVAWKHSENESVAETSSGGGGREASTFLKELKIVAEKAVPFIEQACKERSGQDARARTVAFCGMDGLVAYSMIGEMD